MLKKRYKMRVGRAQLYEMRACVCGLDSGDCFHIGK
jgi:hypothetical protein